jgi:hypothetical protein
VRRTPSLFLLAALAACGAPARPDGSNAKPEAAATSAATPAASPTAAAAPGDEAGRLAEYREDSLRGCIGGAREAAPPGTPVERHCACAVGRVTAGRSRAQLDAEERSGEYEPRFREAMHACIREIGP